MLLGDRPHVIDEWAIAPAIWDEIRHKVDDEPGSKGQWLLTGSSTPPVSYTHLDVYKRQAWLPAAACWRA